MDEFSLGDILQSLKEKFSQGISTKEKIASIVSQVLLYPITVDMVSTRGKKVFITCPPVVKHEILMKKKQCLQELQTEGYFFVDIC